MKKKKTPLWGMLITLGLLIGLIPVGTALADDTAYGIWVEGKEVTPANANDILAGEGKGKVSYDAVSRTLTLENAKLGNKTVPKGVDIFGNGNVYSVSAAILAKEEMTIKLVGENNSITLSDDGGSRIIGLCLIKGGQIIGEGQLTMTGQGSRGIFFNNSLTISEQAKVKLNLSKVASSSYIIGISAFSANELVIQDQADITVQVTETLSYGLDIGDGSMKNWPSAPIFIKDMAKVIVSADSTTITNPLDLSKYSNPFIEVSTKATGSDLTSWDGKTPLSGKDSPYKYIKMKKSLYTITFDPNDGKNSTPKTLGTDSTGRLTAFPAAPTREGYRFHSWNTFADGNGHELDPSHIFTTNTTLYAQWVKDGEANRPLVIFDLNYQGAAKANKLADQNGKLSILPTPTRAGYTFLGWFDNKEGKGLKIAADKVFKNNEVLYAKWAKGDKANGPEVTFDLNYQGAAQASKAKAGQDGKFTTLPTPIRTGYTFLGWFDNKEGKGLKIAADKVFKGGEVLYAKWQKGAGKENIQVTMIINSLDYFVNGQKKTMDAEPLIRQSRTFVPYRALTEAFGAKVDWDGKKRTVTVNLGDKTIVMTIDKKTYTINGVEKTMDVAPYIEKSRTMIPVRFAGEGIGFKVTPSYHTDGTTASVQFEN